MAIKANRATGFYSQGMKKTNSPSTVPETAAGIAEKLIDPVTHPLFSRVPPRTVRHWIQVGRLQAWRVGSRWLTTSAAIDRFFLECNRGRLPRARSKSYVSLSTLETRFDQVLSEFPGIDPDLFGRLSQHLLPELFGRGKSRKGCNVVHGTAPARWRLRERARNLLDLVHPKDSGGIPPENRPMIGADNA